jgi:hypothetical protein
MKPAHPREILRRATRKPDIFSNQYVSMRFGNGSHYQGKWQGCDAESLQVILKDDATGSIIWLDANAIESISFPHATADMLSVLSGRTFDPYTNAEKLGDLAISRQVVASSEALKTVIGKQIKITHSNISTFSSSVVGHVLVDLLRMTEKSFEALCTDDFAKTEIGKLVSEIKMTPSHSNSVELKDSIMSIEFTWEQPDQRWRESELLDAINKRL